VRNAEEKILEAILKYGIIGWAESQTPKLGLAQYFN
jgi:hypothetical protein